MQRAADEARAPRRAIVTGASSGGVARRGARSLARAARGDELPEARRRRASPRVDEARLAEVREREVHVVAAEEQVWPDGDARDATGASSLGRVTRMSDRSVVPPPTSHDEHERLARPPRAARPAPRAPARAIQS